ncbi:hypothetical protein M9Y10_013067 [Tritrichomonas musculus]|uniref:Ras-GEF domain-containing protein n=1 Tax=Tritrichomonas musculus TaxID=1915356 RepID=A0ABR2I671_9EUKA
MNDDTHLAHRTRNSEYQKSSSNNETSRSNHSNSNMTSAKNKVASSNSKSNQDSNSSGDEDKERKNISKRRNHPSLDSTLKKKNYIVNNDDEESENEPNRILSRNQYSNTINRHTQKNNENFRSNDNTNNDNKDIDKSNMQQTSANRRNKSVNQHPKHNGASNELNKFRDSEKNNNNGNNNDREKGRERSESGHHRSSSDAGKHKISDNLAATTNFISNENKSNRKLTQSLIKPLIPEESDSPPPPPSSQRRRNNVNNNDNDNNNNNNTSRNKRNPTMRKRYHDNEVVTLQCSLKPVVVEHYFVESIPHPFTGHLISKCNGRTMKSNMKHEEALQFVSEIIPGPTLQASLKRFEEENEQYQNHKRDKNGIMQNSNIKLGKVNSSSQNRFTTSTSSLISQNSEQVDTDKDKRPKRSKSVSQKADVLVQNLFNEDDPVSYFDFDFATAFTNGISDETTEEILPTMNNFPSVKKLASLQINYDGDPKVVISKLVSPFRSEDQPDQQDFLSLTKTACTSVRKGEIVMSTIRRSRLIESISSSAFTEFRFGTETTEFAPDRLHIFTWHNLGIPTSLISKNLILVFQNFHGSSSSAPNMETLVKAITQYIAIWVRYFPKDFDDFSTCADFILQLLKNMATKCRSCISFINVVGLLISDIYNKTIAPEDVYPPLREPIYKDISAVNSLINLSLDPYVIAQHFAYIDLCLLHKLQRSEFVNNNWVKVQEQMNKAINLNGHVNINNKDSQVNNFQVFLQRFNDTASFIAASILIDTEKRRARNISYWIKMMYHARKVHNYHLLAIIDAGLSCLPVKRLKNSWKLVNDNALIAFHRLHNFFKNEQNQKEMFVDPKNSIPFIGIFLSQLSMIDIDSTKVLMKDSTDQNNDYKQQEVRAYNLNVQRKCFNIIDQIFYPWGVDIDFELDDKILKECKKLTGKAKNAKDLILPSISFEPLRNDEQEIFADFIPRK